MTENGNHATYKNGDDSGMVYGILICGHCGKPNNEPSISGMCKNNLFFTGEMGDGLLLGCKMLQAFDMDI